MNHDISKLLRSSILTLPFLTGIVAQSDPAEAAAEAALRKPTLQDMAQQACGTALIRQNPPAFQDVLIAAHPRSERFMDLLDQGLSERMKASLDVTMLSYDLALTDVSGQPAHFNVEWAGLSALITKSRSGHRLFYQLSNLKLSAEGRDLPLHGRPKGLNVRLSKLMVAVTDAIRADVLGHPGIHEVQIVAAHVANRRLAETLLSIGFQYVPETRFRIAYSRDNDRVYQAQYKNAPLGEEPSVFPHFDDFASASATTELYPSSGRSMYLDLETRH